jgi:hypothetical protein
MAEYVDITIYLWRGMCIEQSCTKETEIISLPSKLRPRYLRIDTSSSETKICFRKLFKRRIYAYINYRRKITPLRENR